MAVGVVGVLGRAVVIPVVEAQGSAIAPVQIHLLILAGKAAVLITTSPRNVLWTSAQVGFHPSVFFVFVFFRPSVCLSVFLSVCLSVGPCLSAGASWPAFCVVYFVYSSSGLPVWLSAFEPSCPTLLSICLYWRRVLLAFFNQSHVIQCTTEKFEI